MALSQFLGGMTAAGLVSGLFPGPLEAETVLGSGTSIARGFCEYGLTGLRFGMAGLHSSIVIEVLLTAAFVFSIFMLATEKHKGSVCGPVCSSMHFKAD